MKSQEPQERRVHLKLLANHNKKSTSSCAVPDVLVGGAERSSACPGSFGAQSKDGLQGLANKLTDVTHGRVKWFFPGPHGGTPALPPRYASGTMWQAVPGNHRAQCARTLQSAALAVKRPVRPAPPGLEP